MISVIDVWIRCSEKLFWEDATVVYWRPLDAHELATLVALLYPCMKS